MKRVVLLMMPLWLPLLGCLSEEEQSTLVSPNPFVGEMPVAGPARARTSFTEPSIETAARVDSLGRKILAANPQIGLRPLFRVIGAPQPEVFHQGQGSLVVTDGLVKQCQTEGELAAVLCHELGKMVSEREALAGPGALTPGKLPPIQVPVGVDSRGSFGSPDGTQLAELAKYSRTPRGTPRAGSSPLPPDPRKLAGCYLTKAGFTANDLEAATPLLQAAEKNSAWEKQLSPTSQAAPARPWSQ